MIAKRIPARHQTSSIARLARYVVNAQGGLDPRSWERTADYILDQNAEKNGQGEKVGGVRVTNCGTDDPATATLLIEATQALNTRSKKDKTYHLVFSFPPGEQPALETLHAIEDELCAAIGFADHQRISAVHIDTDHLHVHVAINKVHPTGHQNIEPFYDKQRLMETCERLEIKYGLQRTNHGLEEIEHERNNRSRRIRLGPEQQPSDRDSRFRRYLRESYNLKIADPPEAETLNGLRNLSGVGVARHAERNPVLLPGHARAGLEQSGTEPIDGLRRPGNGDRADVGGRRKGLIGDRAATVETQSGIETLARYVARDVAPALREATSWPAVHAALAEHGLQIKERGAGLVVGDPGIPLWVRASQCSRDLSMKALADRLGAFEPPAGQEPATRDGKRRYSPKPVHQHPSTGQLFAQYQRERQDRLAQRKAGFVALRKEHADYMARLRHWKATQRALLKVGSRGAVRKVMSSTIQAQGRAAIAKERQVMAARRDALAKDTTMPSWADWLARQAEDGNADALAVLRSRAEREEKLRGDLLTAEQAERAKTVIMKTMKPSARRDGAMAYRTADGGVVIDRKTHVQAQKATAGAALVALSLAAEKFEGRALIVEGTDEFKRDVARLAGLHQIKVTFADPAMDAERRAAEAERQQVPPAAGHDRYSRLVDHGAAPYQHDAGARDSYFVTLEGESGELHTLWGVDLGRALNESGAEIGDRVRVEHIGAQPVTLPDGTQTHRNTWSVAAAPAEAETTQAAGQKYDAEGTAPKDKTTSSSAPDTVDTWIEKRNSSRDKISSIDYHRRWQHTDAGSATYQGRRRMDDGSEVLLLKRRDEMLVKPVSPAVAAKASKWKVGRAVHVDARGRFIDNSRAAEL